MTRRSQAVDDILGRRARRAAELAAYSAFVDGVVAAAGEVEQARETVGAVVDGEARRILDEVGEGVALLLSGAPRSGPRSTGTRRGSRARP